MKTFLITAIVNATSSFRSRSLSEKVYKLSKDCYVVFKDGGHKLEGPFASDHAKERLDLLTTEGPKMVLCLAESNPGATTMFHTSRAAPEEVLKAFLEPHFVSDGTTLQAQWENKPWVDNPALTELATFLYEKKFGVAKTPSKACYAISEVDGLHFAGPMRADEAYKALGTYTKHGGEGVTRMVLCKAAENPGKLTLEREIGKDYDSANKRAREFWMSPHEVTNGEQKQGKWGHFRHWWADYPAIEWVAVQVYESLNAASQFDDSEPKWQWDSSACPDTLPKQKCYKDNQIVDKSHCAHLPQTKELMLCPKQTIIS